MSTMTAAQITDLHARRSAKGEGYAPTLAECLDAAREGRLWDVDTQSAGHDGLTIAQDAETALAEWAAAVSPDAPEVPARWTVERVTLALSAGDAARAYWRAYASVEAANPTAWAPYAHYPSPRPLVSSLVPVADRRRLALLAGAAETAAGDDSETSALWAERRDEWERSGGL